MSSPSAELAVMCGVAEQDIRSVTGANLALLRSETGLDPAMAGIGHIKEKLREKAAVVPVEAKWRVSFLAKLLCQRPTTGGRTMRWPGCLA